MKSQSFVALASFLGLSNSSPVLSKRDDPEGHISSCYDTWMPRDDIAVGPGGNDRPGFNSAVAKFCDAAAEHTLEAGDTYLSYATEVELNLGKDPTVYGQLGFVEFEIHNRQDVPEEVDAANCKAYLEMLSKEGGDCFGPDNSDTKGGTWQVTNNKLSYHAKPSITPPVEDALNKLYEGVITAQTPNKGAGAPLDPWPVGSIDNILPSNAHSHNDYDHQEIPLWNALFTGCISVEADVFYSNGDAEIGHKHPTAGRTLRKQYIEPLAAIIDNNGGSGVYRAKPDAPSFTILVDFKSDDVETLDVVVASLEPLREKGYLTHVDGDQLIERQVTIVASGKADFDRIASGDGVPGRDVFYDAKIDALGDHPYSNLNSYYASAPYGLAGINRAMQIAGAHELGLKVRYYEIKEEDWEELAAAGVDRLNADDLANTSRLARL